MAELTVGYLGPEGTFTHQALDQLVTLPSAAAPVPLPSIGDVITRVESTEFPFGLVPIENSVEGEVTSTLDHLVFRTEGTLIREETVLDITFKAFKRKDFADQASETVISHRQALAQCRKYIASNSLNAQECESTAKACEIVQASDDASLVAIASSKAGDLYGLTTIGDRIEDYPGARTRFLLLSRALAPEQTAPKTAVVITPPDTRTGILASMLISLSEREVGISSFSSRPLKTELGAYCFLVTVEGSIADRRVASALRSILGEGASVKLLGCFGSHPDARVTAPFTQRPPGSISLNSGDEDIRRFFHPPTSG